MTGTDRTLIGFSRFGRPLFGYSSGMSTTDVRAPPLPLARLGVFGKLEVYAVLGYKYPSNSIKYRAARAMIDAAEQRRELHRPMGIVERTSGNTGIALAYEGPQRGYHVRIYTGEGVTADSKRLMKDSEAKVIEAPGVFSEHGELIKELMKAEPGCWYWPDQHSSMDSLSSNVELGYEIARQIRPDIFIASAGTGSTITGVSAGLRESNPDLSVYLVVPEREEFSVPGVDDPSTYSAPLFDKGLAKLKLHVSESDAIESAQRLYHDYAQPVGISSGAVFRATERLGQERGGIAVVMFPDHRNRYTHLLGD